MRKQLQSGGWGNCNGLAFAAETAPIHALCISGDYKALGERGFLFVSPAPFLTLQCRDGLQTREPKTRLQTLSSKTPFANVQTLRVSPAICCSGASQVISFRYRFKVVLCCTQARQRLV